MPVHLLTNRWIAELTLFFTCTNSSMSTTPTPVTDRSVSEVSLYLTLALSILGFGVTIFSYVLTSKWMCCDNNNLLNLVMKCCCSCCDSEDVEGTESPLCNSKATIAFVSALHLLGKPIMIAVDITYLAIVGFNLKSVDFGFREIPLSNISSLKTAGRDTAELITAMCTLYEIIVVFFVPLYFIVILCPWNKKQMQDNKGCASFLEVLRFGDIQVAAILAPFSNVYLFILGGPWYVLIGVRLAFYSITFAAAVIAGVRLVFLCCCCIYLCECGCNSEAVEIKNYKQLLLRIPAKLVSIGLKLMTCSSALSTYFTIGILQPFPVRIAYFTFSMLRGLTALFSLSFNAVLIRWEVLKDDEKANHTPLAGILGFLDEYEPHAHIAFFVDIATYLGLLVLNIYIAVNL